MKFYYFLSSELSLAKVSEVLGQYFLIQMQAHAIGFHMTRCGYPSSISPEYIQPSCFSLAYVYLLRAERREISSSFPVLYRLSDINQDLLLRYSNLETVCINPGLRQYYN